MGAFTEGQTRTHRDNLGYHIVIHQPYLFDEQRNDSNHKLTDLNGVFLNRVVVVLVVVVVVVAVV